MKVISIIWIYLLMINGAFSQQNFENSYSFGYSEYHNLFINLQQNEKNLAVKRKIEDSILLRTIQLRKEEQIVYFSNAIKDTVLDLHIRFKMMILCSREDYSTYVYLKNEFDWRAIKTHCLNDYFNSSNNFFDKYIVIKSMLLLGCTGDYEDYKVYCEELNKLISI